LVSIHKDLQWWDKSLSSYEDTKLISDPDPTYIGWFGDASTGHGVGILIGKRWEQFLLTSLVKQDPKSQDIACLETVAFQLGTLVLLKTRARKGKLFIFWTDNTTTLRTVHTRKSKNNNFNTEWKAIQHLLLKEEVNIQARIVTSSKKRAHNLSRGIREGSRIENLVEITLPEDYIKDVFVQTKTLPNLCPK
jgi:hypothetical protein